MWRTNSTRAVLKARSIFLSLHKLQSSFAPHHGSKYSYDGGMEECQSRGTCGCTRPLVAIVKVSKEDEPAGEW